MLDTQYQAKDHESQIYKMWLDHDFSNPDSEINQNLRKKKKKAKRAIL